MPERIRVFIHTFANKCHQSVIIQWQLNTVPESPTRNSERCRLYQQQKQKPTSAYQGSHYLCISLPRRRLRIGVVLVQASAGRPSAPFPPPAIAPGHALLRRPVVVGRPPAPLNAVCTFILCKVRKGRRNTGRGFCFFALTSHLVPPRTPREPRARPAVPHVIGHPPPQAEPQRARDAAAVGAAPRAQVRVHLGAAHQAPQVARAVAVAERVLRAQGARHALQLPAVACAVRRGRAEAHVDRVLQRDGAAGLAAVAGCGARVLVVWGGVSR